MWYLYRIYASLPHVLWVVFSFLQVLISFKRLALSLYILKAYEILLTRCLLDMLMAIQAKRFQFFVNTLIMIPMTSIFKLPPNSVSCSLSPSCQNALSSLGFVLMLFMHDFRSIIATIRSSLCQCWFSLASVGFIFNLSI